jgi:creatinine amidohydrolase
MLAAIHPELVHLERGEPGYTGDLQQAVGSLFTAGVDAISANGVIGDPAGASAEHGGRYWEKALEVTIAAIGEPDTDPGPAAGEAA